MNAAWISKEWASALSAMTLVLVRVSGLMVFAPVFSSTAIPVRVKAGFVLAVSFLLAPVVGAFPRAHVELGVVPSSADVLGTLNQLVADFSSGTVSSTAQADTQALSTALSHVSQQRVLIDNSLTRLSAAESYTQGESTQLTANQTTLLQADVGQVARS